MYSKIIMIILKLSRKVMMNEIIKNFSKSFSKSFDFENDLFDVKEI